MPTWDPEFARFVAASTTRLHRVGYLLTAGDQHLAEDLVQTALIATYRSWPQLRDPAAAFAYTRTALVRAHTDHTRRRWTRERPVPDHPDRSYEHALDDRLDLLPAVQRLAPRQRAVIVLRFYEDLSERQIAEALRISPGTVKRAAHDALARLRELVPTMEDTPC